MGEIWGFIHKQITCTSSSRAPASCPALSPSNDVGISQVHAYGLDEVGKCRHGRQLQHCHIIDVTLAKCDFCHSDRDLVEVGAVLIESTQFHSPVRGCG